MAYDYLLGYLDGNGNTSLAGQTNAGVFEMTLGGPPAPQQPHESAPAYEARITAGKK